PEAGKFSETPITGDLAKFSVVVFEDADGTPFAGENQLRKTVRIQIAPERGVDDAGIEKTPSVLLVERPFFLLLMEEPRTCGNGVASGNDLATDEQTKGVVAFKVDDCERTRACARTGDRS